MLGERLPQVELVDFQPFKFIAATSLNKPILLYSPNLQVLFYVRLVGDILGRMAPTSWLITSAPKLMLWAILKTAMLPLLFLSILKPHLCLGDIGSLLMIGTFWILSGYLNTCSYLLAPKLVPANQKARASGIMTVAFQISCFFALIFAGFLQHFIIVEEA